MSLIRLDKYLSQMNAGTRSEVKLMIRKGRVFVNGAAVSAPEHKVDTNKDIIEADGKQINYSEYEYYMLNKPAGVVSATEDKKQKTVIDIIEGSRRKDLFPVGRLDKDTEGLLIITNDGELAHNLLSPKKHVDKTYYAKVEGEVTDEDVRCFKEGLKVDDEFMAMPAKLEILSNTTVDNGERFSEILLTICEGKYHQVKRMFEAVGKKVVYLKRMSMGELKLDETLATGSYRELTTDELELLKGQQ